MEVEALMSRGQDQPAADRSGRALRRLNSRTACAASIETTRRSRGDRQLNGYLNATPSEKLPDAAPARVLTYLGQCGATTLLLMTQHGIVARI
jgi:hypothetical protein